MFCARLAFGIFILLLIGFFIPHTLLLHLLNSKGLRRGIENNSQASLMRFISVAQECFRIANPLAFISSRHRKFINFAHRHCAAPILCIPLTQVLITHLSMLLLPVLLQFPGDIQFGST